jgi:hypothetical protein
VSFDKINSQLPGFSCEYTAADGAEELYKLFKKIDLDPEVFNAKPYTRLKQLQFLLGTNQLDKELYWAK